jgi:hypothetical protein
MRFVSIHGRRGTLRRRVRVDGSFRVCLDTPVTGGRRWFDEQLGRVWTSKYELRRNSGTRIERSTPEIARRRARADEQDELKPGGIATHQRSIAAASDRSSLGVRALSECEAVFAGAFCLVERGIGLTEELVGRFTGYRLGDAEARGQPNLRSFGKRYT